MLLDGHLANNTHLFLGIRLERLHFFLSLNVVEALFHPLTISFQFSIQIILQTMFDE